MEQQSNVDMNQTSAKQPVLPIAQFLKENFRTLSKFDQFFFEKASTFVGINSMGCGLIAHSLFRNILKLRRHYLVSAFPIATLSLAMTSLHHEMFITSIFMEGALTCSTCALVIGGYIGVVMGGMAPIFMAGFINLTMVPVESRPPWKGGMMREVISFTRPVISRMKYFLLYQAVSTYVIVSRQYDTREKLFRMLPASESHV